MRYYVGSRFIFAWIADHRAASRWLVFLHRLLPNERKSATAAALVNGVSAAPVT